MAERESQYSSAFFRQYLAVPDEISDRVRTEHPAEYEGVRHCIGLILVNLLDKGQVAYSRNKNFYTKNRAEHFTYTNMMKAVKIAVTDGYALEWQKGYKNQEFTTGLSSTLKAGPRLKEINRPKEVKLDVKSLPLLTIDKKPIFNDEGLLLLAAHPDKLEPESFSLLPRLNEIYSQAVTLNREYWNKVEIDTSQISLGEECLNLVGLTRVFKTGGVGRWCQKGGDSYQELSDDNRVKLLINGEKVVEIDYHAMHPHLMYYWENEQCPDDFYEMVMSQCGCSRFIAKSVVLVAVNATTYAKMISGINLNKAKETKANKHRAKPKPILYDELKKSVLTPAEVVEAIKTAHPTLAKYIYSGSANKLMLEESEIMTSVLCRLMKNNVPALPIHDSVLVPARCEEVTRQAMTGCYHERTGFHINLKIQSPPL